MKNTIVVLILSLSLIVSGFVPETKAVIEVIYQNDFDGNESGNSAPSAIWQFFPTQYLNHWHLSNRYSASGNTSFWCGKIDNSWVDSTGYGNNWTDTLSLTLYVGGYTEAVLSFKHRYDIEPLVYEPPLGDHCFLIIDGQQIKRYEGTQNAFIQENINITNFILDGTINIKWAFNSDFMASDEDGFYNSDGAWYIDDIMIYTSYSDTVPPTITIKEPKPKDRVGNTGPDTIKARIIDDRSGIASAYFHYSTDGIAVDTLMDTFFDSSNGMTYYIGIIPTQTFDMGVTVFYYVSATDSAGNSSATAVDSFHIFEYDISPPEISVVGPSGTQIGEDTIIPDTVYAYINDISPIRDVYLNYSVNDSPYISEPMLPIGNKILAIRSWRSVVYGIIPGRDYSCVIKYYVSASDIYNNTDSSNVYTLYLSPTSIDDKHSLDASALKTFVLYQNYPNPFNPSTTINYKLPADDSNDFNVSLQIYNLDGQLIRTLVNAENQKAGQYSVVWNGLDNKGRQVSSGIYTYRLRAANNNGMSFDKSKRMILLK